MKKLFVIVLVFAILMLCGCKSHDEILLERMIPYYSDDSNFVTLTGTVVIPKVTEPGQYVVGCIVINCPDIEKYTSTPVIDSYSICSDKELDIQTGDTITFVTAPFHFYNHKLPVVSIIIDGEVLLDFETGREYLIADIIKRLDGSNWF